MANNEIGKRAWRIVRLLVHGGARLRETGKGGTFLIEIPGERAVRCPGADLDDICGSGMARLVTIEGERHIHLTAEGHCALRRRNGDLSDSQRDARRRTVIDVEGRSEIVTVDDSESPLAAMTRLRRADGSSWLDREEIAAGELLRADFERAMLQPRISSSWDFSISANAGPASRNTAAVLTDSALAARDRVNRAMDAVGPELGGILVDFCCFLKGLEQVERERSWPRRSAKLMLKTALRALDRHYHPENAGSRKGGILHWGCDGYRPQPGS